MKSIAVKQPIVERQLLLELIRTTWIDGVLEPSLAGVPYISQRLQQWTALEAQQEKPESLTPLPLEMHITDIYNRTERRLFIVGEASAGKTTLLLELLSDLLDRAEQDAEFPIPVVLNLSSWATKRLPLEEYLEQELMLRYQLRKADAGQFLLLLDGLDEMNGEDCCECLKIINTYQEMRDCVPPVICCGHKQYVDLQELTQLHSAVKIQLLTDEQIDEYISGVPERQDALRDALANDTVLRDMARWPLMLRMLFEVYQRASHIDLSATDRAKKFRQLCAAYVQSSSVSQAFADQQCWLSWLAQQLWTRKRTEFRMDQLQAGWLPTKRWLWIYRILMGLLLLPATGFIYDLAGLNWRDHSSIVLVLALIVVWLTFIVPISFLRRRVDADKEQAHIHSVWILVGVLGGGQFQDLLGTFIIEKVGWFVVALGLPLLFELIMMLRDRHMSMRPDRWLRRAGQHAVISGLLGFLLLSLWGWLAHGMTGLLMGMHLGMLYGLSIGLGLGGHIFIEHFVLRFCFWYLGYMPWRYGAFLDNAVERKLLYRIGPGYIFCHRLLLDYLASAKR